VRRGLNVGVARLGPLIGEDRCGSFSDFNPRAQPASPFKIVSNVQSSAVDQGPTSDACGRVSALQATDVSVMTRNPKLARHAGRRRGDGEPLNRLVSERVHERPVRSAVVRAHPRWQFVH